jgi:hypothetical protein
MSSFAEASAVAPREDGSLDTVIDTGWTVGGKPHGGYLLGLLGRAVLTACPQPHVLAASAHYLHSPDPGPARAEVELLRAGRSASQVRGRLSQDGRACVEALFTIGTLDPAAEPYWAGGIPEPRLDAGTDAVRLPVTAASGLQVTMHDVASVSLDRADVARVSGQPSGRGELRGWLALPEGEQFDPLSLLFAVDALPPATLDVAPSGWVPTLELTAYVRALPAPGPVRVLQRVQLIEAGRFDEVCFVWDSRGRLVAQATQLAGIRLG